MAEGKLRYYLVSISSALSLAQDVALVDELGQNPVGRALRDPYRGRDVAQADAGVMSHAQKNMGVVCQKVPGGRPLSPLALVSRS
jgi:hypothetical protein